MSHPGEFFDARQSNALDEPFYLVKSRLQGRLNSVSKELQSIEDSIADLQAVRSGLLSERTVIQTQLDELSFGALDPLSTPAYRNHASTSKSASEIDYTRQFEWTDTLRSRMEAIFGISSFRLCQEG
jgi:ATP-dependent DNA helicase Q1